MNSLSCRFLIMLHWKGDLDEMDLKMKGPTLKPYFFISMKNAVDFRHSRRIF